MSSYKECNRPLGHIYSGELLDKVIDYLLLKKDFIPGVTWHYIIAILSQHRGKNMPTPKQRPYSELQKHTLFAFNICISNKAWQTTT
jgi:hypothetical protein